MKQLLIALSKRAIPCIFFFLLLFSGFIACRKTDNFPFPGFNQDSHYPSDVIDKWITMQLRLMRDATGIPNVAFARPYVYSGIAAYESLAPGMGLVKFEPVEFNGLGNLPQMDRLKRYYSPASVNASLASMNRNLFPNAIAADKAAIDSLENALNNAYLSTENHEVITRSNAFGKAIADAVFNWSETDRYKDAGNPYTPPAGPGLWVPTPPAFAPASTPYWGDNRPTIAGSILNSQPGAPIPYSESPKSFFYQMAMQVYTASQNLTLEQTNMALFWRDIPGVSSPGHWLSILQQVLKQTNTHLDKAAFAYAITGACLNDAAISCWQTKYHYNLVRPITYIRNVIGFTTWNSLLTTPAHPEYSSAHATISASAAEAFTAIFGKIGSFTDHTYDYLGFAPRSFSSFRAIGIDAGNSRLYAGIHYQPSIDAGMAQGRKVASNILISLGLRSKDDE